MRQGSVQVADMVCERTKIMKWLLGRVRQREFDSVKQYASEVLAILVQDSSANRKRLVDGNGIDVLLQAWPAVGFLNVLACAACASQHCTSNLLGYITHAPPPSSSQPGPVLLHLASVLLGCSSAYPMSWLWECGLPGVGLLTWSYRLPPSAPAQNNPICVRICPVWTRASGSGSYVPCLTTCVAGSGSLQESGPSVSR